MSTEKPTIRIDLHPMTDQFKFGDILYGLTREGVLERISVCGSHEKHGGKLFFETNADHLLDYYHDRSRWVGYMTGDEYHALLGKTSVGCVWGLYFDDEPEEKSR